MAPSATGEQPALLLRGGAAEQHRLRGQVERGGQRHRAELAAELLGHHAQLHRAEAGAAAVLGQHQRRGT
jgi:hypothetical protein